MRAEPCIWPLPFPHSLLSTSYFEQPSKQARLPWPPCTTSCHLRMVASLHRGQAALPQALNVVNPSARVRWAACPLRTDTGVGIQDLLGIPRHCLKTSGRDALLPLYSPWGSGSLQLSGRGRRLLRGQDQAGCITWLREDSSRGLCLTQQLTPSLESPLLVSPSERLAELARRAIYCIPPTVQKLDSSLDLTRACG